MAEETGLYNIAPGETPTAVSSRRKIAEALLMQGMQTTPIQSGWQGAARLAQALIGGYGVGSADADDAAGVSKAMKQAMAGINDGPQASAPAGMPQAAPLWLQSGAQPAPQPPRSSAPLSATSVEAGTKAGLYDPSVTKPPTSPVASALAGPAPMPAAPPVQPQAPRSKNVNPALVASLFNPYLPKGMQELAIAKAKIQMAPDEYNIHQREDGAIVATNKGDPRDMHVITPPGASAAIAGQKGANKRAEQTGEAQGKAEVGVGPYEDFYNQQSNIIGQIEKHPGRQWGLGIAGAIPANPFMPQAAAFADLVEQLKHGAFGEAYKSLRGGGQISNIEGEKMQGALLRASRARDQADFNNAINDYKEVLRQSRERNKAQSRGIPSVSVAPGPSDPLGLR